MRWLIFFVLTFVLIFAGCATTSGYDFLDNMMGELEGPRFEENWKPVRERGWTPITQDGNHWALYAPIGGELNLIATCDYRGYKVDSIEKWKGKYFGMKDDLNFHGPVWNNDLDNLVGCVEWVKMFYYGDYTI